MAYSSSLSVSCPSLGSALIAMARARLWSSFKWRSESPLLAHQETKRQEKVFCLFAAADFFPDSLPASRGALAPSGCVHAATPSPLPGIRPKPEPQLPAPARPGGGAYKPLGLVSAGQHRYSVRESLRFALRTPVAALSSVALKLPPPPPAVCAREGAPSVWKPFLLHSSFPLVQVPTLFFCLCYFFFLLPYPGTWEVSCLLGGLTSSASVQWVFYRSSSTCRCISDVSVGRKVISTSYSSSIFSSLHN